MEIPVVALETSVAGHLVLGVGPPDVLARLVEAAKVVVGRPVRLVNKNTRRVPVDVPPEEDVTSDAETGKAEGPGLLGQVVVRPVGQGRSPARLARSQGRYVVQADPVVGQDRPVDPGVT